MADEQTMAPVQEPEKQDLHVAELSKPDQSWTRTQPLNMPPPQWRLDAAHQLVTIRNTSDSTPGWRGHVRPQMHIVIDRFNVGHELKPGETKRDVDMLVSEIENFLKLRAPNRFDRQGNKLPQHPIEIMGFKPIEGRVEEPQRRKSA